MARLAVFGPKVPHPFDAAANHRHRIELHFVPGDLWIGAFVADDAVYLIIVPTIVVRVARGRTRPSRDSRRPLEGDPT